MLFGARGMEYDRLAHEMIGDSLSRRLGWMIGGGVILAVGVWLRFYQIFDQVLLDDEWHALQLLRYTDAMSILFEFHANDVSIPLTFLYKLLYERDLLSEFTMRLPLLVAGVAALFCMPYAVRRYFPLPVGLLFSSLIAVSPMYVYYSRFARPYALLALLSFVGVAAFVHWQEGRRRRFLGLYAFCVVLGGYLNQSALPFLLSPALAFALKHRNLRQEAFFYRMAAGSGFVFLAFVLPPLLTTPSGFTSRLQGNETLPLRTLVETYGMLLGSSHLWLSLVLSVVLILGLAYWRGSDRKMFWAFVLASLVQLLSVLILRPTLVSFPMVLGRYLISLHGVALLGIACGLYWLVLRLKERWGRFAWGVPALVLGACVFWQPYWRAYYAPNQFMGHWCFQSTYFYYQGETYDYCDIVTPPKVSPFYDRLAQHPPGSLRIVEVPWYYENHNNSHMITQRMHRQRVYPGMLAYADPWARKGDFPKGGKPDGFRNFVKAQPPDVLAEKGIDLIIVHKDYYHEVPQVVDYQWLGREKDFHFDPLLSGLNDQFGAPYYEDELIYVFMVR